MASRTDATTTTTLPAISDATTPPLSSSLSGDAVLRAELVTDSSGKRPPRLVALRRMRWGVQILSERPLLLVDPGDPDKKEVLSLWRENIEVTDPIAGRLFKQNQSGIGAFLEDHPEFAKLVNWAQFILVSSIFARFGVQNPDGSLAVYLMSSAVRHSCRPNAAAFSLRRSYPWGRRLLHVTALEGVAKGEEITISEESESVLCLPFLERSTKLFAGSGVRCDCSRCLEEGALVKFKDMQDDQNEDEEQDEAWKPAPGPSIPETLSRLHALLAIRPPTDESTKEATICLKTLDKLLPFSMQIKAKAKVMLASALGELNNRAAWQEGNQGANIIQWTGLDAEGQEARLRETKRLYETAAKDFEYLLGQDALAVLQRIEAGYNTVRNQHKVVSKYTRDREPPPGSTVAGFRPEAATHPAAASTAAAATAAAAAAGPPGAVKTSPGAAAAAASYAAAAAAAAQPRHSSWMDSG
eukprot:CAMPEP_0206601886 /NCGR_PEP_ID=MMETSP0325_2-20121206/46946_1 /ASSEMBLY_ACC=CAM_ASM_000347 /TAXON_ID=2866 /ORGANISM="Crypthecodinium cohnii, Strain Seligo" /LENGTH=469 /DNA_ID=CAMNT_0054114043 /DNA_START=75 /DNA_END=1481 /DNA_ORIENTATION=-